MSKISLKICFPYLWFYIMKYELTDVKNKGIQSLNGSEGNLKWWIWLWYWLGNILPIAYDLKVLLPWFHLASINNPLKTELYDL